MPHATVTLTGDEIDDLIYFSRAGDLDSLKESIESLSRTHSCSTYSVVAAAIDVDQEGLGSGSCLLHYPAANGSLDVVTYLLSLASVDMASSTTQNGDAGSQQEVPARSSQFVNHQNVSGNTALHWAGMNGHLSIVQALIKAGADPEIVNGAGRDAVVESEWSSKDGADECAVWILKECGALEKGLGHDAAEGESSERVAENEAEEDVPATTDTQDTNRE